MEKYNVHAALKKILKVKETTLKTYARNIKRLAKEAGFDNVPSNKGWLVKENGKKLVSKISKMPNNIGRHLFLAGNIAVRMYTQDKDRSSMWAQKTNESSNRYSEDRDKQKKSPSETKNWGKGYQDIKKAARLS